ncbi:MAG: helix-hairpin-helix domain-containing protein [Gammaproteobacteria bacterium]|nr:helix-hairpin-helix domain-containing protein [Gammaproteobacteria bacterium]
MNKLVYVCSLVWCMTVTPLWAAADQRVIDINTADAATLATLAGVGEKRAEAIIAYRKANGPFKDVAELKNVKGIGEVMLEQNRTRLTVKKDRADTAAASDDKVPVSPRQ